MWIAGYAVFFGMLTLQDQLSGPQAVPYTEFKGQVAAQNITEVFSKGDTIEGALKKAASVPGQSDRTYQQFTTERPTFANDDLLSELTQGEASCPSDANCPASRVPDEPVDFDGAHSVDRGVLRVHVPASASRHGRDAWRRQAEARRSGNRSRHLRRCGGDR